jgi:hypothetical protein
VERSRATEASRVYAVADDTAMAAEDLGRNWKRKRRPTWAIDTGLPATGDLTPETVEAMTTQEKARALAIAHAETAGPVDPGRAALERQLAVYRARLDTPTVDRSRGQAVGLDI